MNTNQFLLFVSDDFVPASVDPNKTSLVDFGGNGKVTVTMPNLEGSGTGRESVYQGMRKPHQKECVLIFNPETGELVLEKLNTSMIVKKARLRQEDMTGKSLNSHSNNQKNTLSNGSSSGPSTNQAKSSIHNDKVCTITIQYTKNLLIHSLCLLRLSHQRSNQQLLARTSCPTKPRHLYLQLTLLAVVA